MDRLPEEPVEAEVIRLCDRLLDDVLSVEEKDRLERLVLSDRRARRCYVEQVHLHAALREARFKDPALGDVLKAGDAVGLPREGVARWRDGSRLKRWLALAAGVALLAAGWAAGRWQETKPEGVVLARLVEVRGARWEGGALPTQVGAAFSQGRLRLAAGLATVEFGKGARVTMEGPSELEIVSEKVCRVHAGAVTAHVPPPAIGFVVETEHARVVDYGTDFGVSVGRRGEARVQVFEGKVELEHRASGKKLALASQEGARIVTTRLEKSGRTENETEVASLLGGMRGEREGLSITTADGEGKAAYVWSPGTHYHFGEGLLLVKHCDPLAFRRKAWLGFDLGKLKGRKVQEATLTLMFAATGWGYASLVPEAEFTVFGVKEDGLDGWREETLTWANAPANDVEGGGVDLSKAVKLGSFRLPEGVLEGAMALSGTALRDFLNADGNGFATLVVVRNTSEPRGGGVVHGFAGNDHPVLRPPTLRVLIEKE